MASFVEHPPYSYFKIYNAMILVFFILACHYLPKFHVEKLFILNTLAALRMDH